MLFTVFWMGEFSKETLVSFIEFDCDRRLFIDIAKGNPNWIDPIRDIIPPNRTKRSDNKFIKAIGKKYEQLVYNHIRHLNSKFHQSPKGEIVRHRMNVNELSEFNFDTSIVLLEHGFEIPYSFYELIFDDKSKYDGIELRHNLYPDLIILKKNSSGYGVNPDGTLSYSENKTSINILDIKSVNFESIGKRHFIEIVYYMIAFAHYLKENKLDDQYYIAAEGNGIFPGYSDIILNSIDDIFNQSVPVVWEHTHILFDEFRNKIKEFTNNIPMPIENSEVNISTDCGRCAYYEDCIHTLKYNEESPETIDIRLMPYMKSSIAENLMQHGIFTVDDITKKITQFNNTTKPDPIYPEVPILELKAKSLKNKKQISPENNEIYSTLIPRFNDISVVFNAEKEAQLDRVFGFSIYYEINVWQTSKYGLQFMKFMMGIHDILLGKLDEENFRQRYRYNELPIKELKQIVRTFRKLERYNSQSDERKYIKWHLPGKREDGSVSTNLKYTNIFTFINQGIEDSDEYAIVKAFITIVYDLIIINQFIANYIVQIETHRNNLQVVYSPSSAFFYWSNRVLGVIETMLQRHMMQLFVDHELSGKMDKIIFFFTPQDSEIKHYQQHQKIFDLQSFTESTQGLPLIINYTWHGLHHLLTGYKTPSEFYAPHFNYMDHRPWYEFLYSRTQQELNLLGSDRVSRETWELKIKDALEHKVLALNTIKKYYQSKGKHLISKLMYRPADMRFSSKKLPANYNPISHIWFAFSALTGSISEQSTIMLRHIYPQFSIGKLEAAEVIDLEVIKSKGKKGGKHFVYKMRLCGISSNVKFKENDGVLLIHKEMRDTNYVRPFSITIQDMIWQNGCFKIVSTESNTDVIKKTEEMLNKKVRLDDKWYIYPNSGDYWTPKLFGKYGLFQRKHIGLSWLGYRLAYLSGLHTTMDPIENQTVFMQEVYLYAPDLLYKYNNIDNNELQTNMMYQPDNSQLKAIQTAMGSVISAMQGPPGTGKSATITTMLDEFVLRRKKEGKSTKILITAFSYQALNVLVDKIATSLYKNRTPSEISKLERVYIRSKMAQTNNKTRDLVHESGTTWKLDGKSRLFQNKTILDHLSDSFIMFAGAHNLVHLGQRKTKKTTLNCIPEDFSFDLIVCDEASQIPVDQFIAALQFVKPNPTELKNLPYDISIETLQSISIDVNPKELTKVVIVGDYEQLPPVQTVKPPKNLEFILGSVYNYYIKHHNLKTTQLQINYRSNEIIVGYTKLLGLYSSLHAYNKELKLKVDIDKKLGVEPIEFYKKLISPDYVVCSIIHDSEFETSISMIEAEIAVNLIIAYFNASDILNEYEEKIFWQEKIGIIAPHNAQSRLIIRKLTEELHKRKMTLLDNNELMQLLRNTIFSVEKFQGSDRDFIIATIGVSSKDQLRAEEEFIYELNRFNVLTSRAKSKIVLISSRNFLDYVPNDRIIMEYASKIRSFAYTYCDKGYIFKYPFNKTIRDLEFRYRDHI